MFEIVVGVFSLATRNNFFGPVGDRLICATNGKSYGASFSRLNCYIQIAKDSSQLSEDELHHFKPPKNRTLRKSKTLEIGFLSELSAQNYETDNEEFEELSAINDARVEFLKKICLIEKLVKSSDDFRVAEFLNDCDLALADPFQSLQEVADFYKQSLEITHSPEQGSSDEWTGLDLDHAKYSNNAVDVLNAPFFWDRGGELAPHGSDLGSGVLEKWLESDFTSGLDFLPEVLENADVQISNVRDSTRDRHLYGEDARMYQDANSVIIAVALCEIKSTSTCSKDLLELARRAVARELQPHVVQEMSNASEAELKKNLAETDQVFSLLLQKT